MEAINVRGRIRTDVGADLRTGFCENCGFPTEKQLYYEYKYKGKIVGKWVKVIDPLNPLPPDRRLKEPRKAKGTRSICPKCGGVGRLIVRSVPIHPPLAPQCLKPRCLWHFLWESIFIGLLAKYHHDRVEYAQENQNKTIPSKYRTGKDCPMTIRGAIIEIAKLKLRR